MLAYLLARTCTFFYRRLNMQDEHSFVALFGLVLLAIAVAHLFKLSTILAEAFPQEVQTLYKQYAEAYASGQNFVNLTLVSDLGK